MSMKNQMKNIPTLPQMPVVKPAEPLLQLEVLHHWSTVHDDMGYRVCTVYNPTTGVKEEFVTKDNFFIIIDNVKRQYNKSQINVYYDYEWRVM